MDELKVLLKHIDPEVRRQALKDLKKKGDEFQDMVPALINCLEDESWRVRNTAIEMLLEMKSENVINGLINTLYKENANARNAAIEALIGLGNEATDHLIEEFKKADTGVKKFIIDILGNTRDLKAFPLLLKSLESEDENVRATVVEHIGNIRKNISVINALIDVLRGEDAWTAYHAADALGKIGDPRAVEALVSVLSRNELRKPAITALGQIAEPRSLSSIVPFLKDGSRGVREEVVKSIAKFFQKGVSEETIIENIKRNLQDEQSDFLLHCARSNKKEVKTSAILLLGLLRDESVIDHLVELSATEEFNEPYIRVLVFVGRATPELLTPFFKSDDPYKRRVVCLVAGRINSPVFFEPLVECLKDEDGHVRGNAALTLSNLNDPKVIEFIKPLILDKYENVQEEAIRALAKLKRWINLDEIIKGLSDKNSALRRNTVLLLGLLKERSTVEALGTALKDSDIRVRIAAVEALDEIDGTESVKFLLFSLTDESPDLRRLAALSIGRMRAEEGIEPLNNLLLDVNSSVRAAAVEALGNIGNVKAVGPLIKLLSDRSGLVKTSAIEALGNFKNDDNVRSALLQLFNDDDAEIRTAAIDSLASFDNIMHDLIPLLGDREWSVRKKVVDVLGKYFKNESYAQLRTVASSDEDPQVREAAEGYLNA